MKKSDLFMSSIQAYKKYNNFNHLYNRIDILKDQDIDCEPVGIMPSQYPIIIKPIINIINNDYHMVLTKMTNEREYLAYLKEYIYKNNNLCGNFWYSEIKGNHYISNLLIKNGKVVFNDTFLIHKNEDNIPSFYKHVYDYILTEYLTETISILMNNYTGPACIQFIDNIIIDCRLSWWEENHIFKKYSDFVSCIPIFLEHNKPLKMLTDDIVYIPFRKNAEDTVDYISSLKRFSFDYNIVFKNKIHNSIHQICMFVVNWDRLNDVLAIRGKLGLF